MPFDQEVDKVAKATEAVTSRWKTWALAGAFIFAVIVAAIVIIRLVF